LRPDVLNAALDAQLENGGQAGVDGEELAAINATPEVRQPWANRLQADLQTKTHRPQPVRRMWLRTSGGGERPLGIPTVKDRVVNIRQTGLNFPGYNLTWRKSFRGRGDPHVEPSQKSRQALRGKLRDRFNHRTLWRQTSAVVNEANRVLRGRAGYCHYGNSMSVMRRMRNDSRHRLRRWFWRKHACRYGLWEHYPDEQLHPRYGPYELPTTAKWQAA
jgi:hypothetical protein